MRHTAPLLALSALLVVAGVSGCTSGGASGTSSGDLVVHDDPVPAGTPVMYEFFTET